MSVSWLRAYAALPRMVLVLIHYTTRLSWRNGKMLSSQMVDGSVLYFRRAHISTHSSKRFIFDVG